MAQTFQLLGIGDLFFFSKYSSSHVPPLPPHQSTRLQSMIFAGHPFIKLYFKKKSLKVRPFKIKFLFFFLTLIQRKFHFDLIYQ